MNRPLARIIYKYLKEYKKQVCDKCTYKGSITCQISNGQIGCSLKNLNEKKMCGYIAHRLTVGELK